MAGRKPTEVDAAIGKAIRAARTAQDMRQLDLARAIGIGQSRIWQYEKGITSISAAVLLNVAEVLQAPIASFFAGAAQGPFDPASGHAPAPDADVQHFLRSEVGQSLVARLACMGPAALNLVEKTVDLVDEDFARAEPRPLPRART